MFGELIFSSHILLCRYIIRAYMHSPLMVTVPQGKITYPIHIGAGLLERLGEYIRISDFSRIVVITDSNVERHYLPRVRGALQQDLCTIVLKPGEHTKNIHTVIHIWEQMAAYACDRKSVVINLGGGVIGDMGGFAASTYMRGVPFVQVPTSLLAQVDESVGGKVGVNFQHMKSGVGAFAQPHAVIIDTNTLHTLPDREFYSGFGEIIKHGVVWDESYYQLLQHKDPRDYSSSEMTDIITQSCAIKAAIVTQDITEQMGIRKIVNFGHTIGHAIEVLSFDTSHPLLHGEAVSIGMVAEAELSRLCGYITQADVDTLVATLEKAHLPVGAEGYSVKAIEELIKKDKKNAFGQIKWTLLEQVGKAIYDVKADGELVRKAIEKVV